jgi:hypothetical protein
MFKIEYKSIGWWYWLVTAGLLTYRPHGISINPLRHSRAWHQGFPGTGSFLVFDAASGGAAGAASIDLLDSHDRDVGPGDIWILRDGAPGVLVALESQ